MTIVLNEAEQIMAQFIAKSRYDNARKLGLAISKIGKQSHEFTDLNGIGAEIAYCKHMNIYPDTETVYEAHELPPYDCVTADGTTIDVKATKYKNGRLLATLNKGKIEQPDGYVLVTGTFPEYTVVGYMAAEDLLKDEMIDDLGHGKGYMATQDMLSKEHTVSFKPKAKKRLVPHQLHGLDTEAKPPWDDDPLHYWDWEDELEVPAHERV
jgi:hypothetical protein